MRFESIEFKNIFAYGEAVQKIEYSDSGKLILLKGMSGSGKSAILSLPILVLYGKLTKVTKTGIANRVNKHGWVRGTLVKGTHTYVIEREFSPNSVKVWKDDEELDFPGTAQAEAYIENEIIEIPITTFTNMITISMKKFKSFLSMSPTERKQVVDEVFDVSIINMIGEQLKKDIKEIGQRINGENATYVSLSQTLNNANVELIKIQEKNATPDALDKIQENNATIEHYTNECQKYNETLNKVFEKQNENNTLINQKQQEYMNVHNALKIINDKINLFNQSKCPTCSTAFVGEMFDNLKMQLVDVQKQNNEKLNIVTKELSELKEKGNKIVEAVKQINDAVYQLRIAINNLQNENRLIDEKIKASSEYQAVENIINNTSKQLEDIKLSIEEKTKSLKYLQKLQMIYSIDGVTKLVINNYLPLLNDEIAENLLLLNFPYTLTFDDKFTPHIKDLGLDVQVETLSDGEQTRVDLVVLCSLFKLLKRKYPSINILTIDESISTLDTVNSSSVLDFLAAFAMENDLNCFIVSHTDLYMENFNQIIEVEKSNGFSHLTVVNTIA